MDMDGMDPPAADGEHDVGKPTDGFAVESLWRACERLVPPPGPDPLPGRTLGGVRLVRVIAEGGMGRVYEAEQENPRRRVAVKVMRPGLLSPESICRFVRETRLLGGLRHPWICQVFAAGTFDFANAELPYFVMELIPDAKPLNDYVRDENLPVPLILDLFRQVCDAVSHAHRQGVVHRDLKPSNVLVDCHGHPKLIDFGIARGNDGIGLASAATDAGRILGTLQYASPEQVAGQPHDVDPRMDVYSLGVMLYELLAGKPPYDIRRASLLESVRIIHGTRPRRLRTINRAVPRRIEAIVATCLGKDPRQRFATAVELAAALGGGRISPARGPLPGPRTAVTIGAVAAGLALPVALAALAWSTWSAGRGTEPAAETTRIVTAAGPSDAAGGAIDLDRDNIFRPRLPRAGSPSGTESIVIGRMKDGTRHVPDAPTVMPSVVNSIGIEMRRLPGGTFVMGDAAGEADEIPRSVTISRPFWLGVHEVTNHQWNRLMRDGTPAPEGLADTPVADITWTDAQEFCRRMSALPQERAAERLYRLPTEAEWEYACRAGTATRYSFGDDLAGIRKHAWFGDNSGRSMISVIDLWTPDRDAYARLLAANGCRPHAVGSLPPNPWGFYDMHGNVWEWCSDWYAAYGSSVSDPSGPQSGTQRVYRGGSWFNGPHDLRSSRRFSGLPGLSRPMVGMRVAMDSVDDPAALDVVGAPAEAAVTEESTYVSTGAPPAAE
jgi:formylglycine-generating enzyme required for sulfatase activity